MRAAMYMAGLRPGSVSWSIYRAFARALRGEGIDFELLTDAPAEGAPDVEGTTFLPVADPAFLDRALAPLTRTPRLLPQARALGDWLRGTDGLDALYIEMAYPLGAAAWLGIRRSGWKGALVVTPMGEDLLVVPDASYGFRRFPLPRWLVSRTLKHARGIRCISPMIEELTAGLDVPRPVIPLSVAEETVGLARRPEPERVAHRQRARRAVYRETGIEARRLVISLGRLHPFKGIDVLVEAMVTVPDTELLIVGPSLEVRGHGDTGTALREQAKDLGLSDRVRVAGPVPHDDVHRYLAAADVLVVPSLRESLNKVCAEAAAVGTPFVVTHSTGAAAFVEDGAGLVVPPRSPEAIAGAVRRVLSGAFRQDPEAARRFVERFAPESVAPRVAALLRQAVG